jgi:hypothetical protein
MVLSKRLIIFFLIESNDSSSENEAQEETARKPLPKTIRRVSSDSESNDEAFEKCTYKSLFLLFYFYFLSILSLKSTQASCQTIATKAWC